MKQPRRQPSVNGSDSSANKETRWDRIRKRCLASSGGSGNLSLKTETVRRFIEMDFVGKRNANWLRGDQHTRSSLNPLLIMDLRHDMFKKIPRQLPLATVEHQKNNQSCRAHNVAVEEHYITHEINALRQQLDKNRKRNQIQPRREMPEENLEHFVDNKSLMESFEAVTRHLEDFYSAPLEAMEEVQQLCQYDEEIFEQERWEDDCAVKEKEKNHLNQLEFKMEMEVKLEANSEDEAESELLLSETIKIQLKSRAQKGDKNQNTEFVRRTPSPLTPTDEFLKPMREAGATHQAEMRRVRFEDEMGNQCKFQRQNSSCSNTSEGLDSIISDLAEEALNELEMELKEEEKRAPENLQNNLKEEEKIEKSFEERKENPKDEENEKSKNLQLTSKEEKNEDLLIIRQIKAPPRMNEEKDVSKENPYSSDDTRDEDDSVSNHEQNLIIEQLFQSRTETNEVVLRKYFLKWIHYTTISKIERESMSSKNNRIQQINAFLNEIRKEKKRISKSTKEVPPKDENQGHFQPKERGNAQITKKYQNKIKMQQDIIDLQRLKLERQERLIMELKLKKLSDEAKEARQDIKNELKAVIRSGDAKSKAKAKCLQLIGNLRDEEDEDDFKRLRGKSLMMPKFLLQMQERALERSIRHEQARQRRLQLEAEREAQKIAAEEAKRQEDEEAKRLRIETLKEKRRQEKMAKVLKERERQRAIENNRKAQEYNRHRLLERFGMEGFRRLLQRKRDYTKKCESLRRRIIRRSYFIAWRDFYHFQMSRRILKADNFYSLILKRQALQTWLSYVAAERSQYYVAMDWYDMKLSTFMFREWAEYVKSLKMIEATKMRKAISHYNWNLKFKVLDCWQRLPQILQLEKETEERRQRWRMKIWELLPDYTPRLDTFV